MNHSSFGLKHPRVAGQRWPFWVLALAVVVLAARLALPYAVKSYMNERLASLGNYRGHVEDVGISLWRGAYQLRGLRIVQLDSAVDEPLFAAPVTDVQILWPALFAGSVVARIEVGAPKLSFAAGHGGRAAQTGKGVDWIDLVKRLTPFRIDRLVLTQGQIHYYDLYSSPKVDVHLDEVEALLTNLTNARDKQGRRVAELQLKALAMAESNLELNLSIDPFAAKPDFKLRTKLLGLKVTSMREAMRAYTPFDPSSGTLDLVVEATGKDGAVEGYVKPLFTDLRLLNWQQPLGETGNPFRFVFNVVGSVLNLVLQNQPKDQLATRLPFSGRLDEPNVEVLPALGNLLKNAFIKAFTPEFERSTKPADQDR